MIMNTQSSSTQSIIAPSLIPSNLFEEMNREDDCQVVEIKQEQTPSKSLISPPPPPMMMTIMAPSVNNNKNVNMQQRSHPTNPFTTFGHVTNGILNSRGDNGKSLVSNVAGVVNNSSTPLIMKPSTQTWGRLKLVGEACVDAPPEFLLSETRINIGRSLNSHVKITSNSMAKFVSRNHADIVKMNDHTFLLTDLGSTNGTLLNGKKIGKETAMRHGDLIIITGGVKALIGEFIHLENGKKRSDFPTNQEWKCALISNVKNAFMYRFEMTQTQFIAKNMNPVKSAINFKVEGDSFDSSASVIQKPAQQLNGKRVRQEGSESIESESSSKKQKESWNTFTEECKNEFNCSICCNLILEPTLLECGHSFCRKCLHDWLAKNKTCPLCRKKLSHPAAPNRSMETVVKVYLEKCSPEEEAKEFEERAKAVKLKDDEDLAKFETMVQNAKAKKIKFLDVTVKWKLEEKRTFKNGIRQYFGKCRDEFCKLVGITEAYVNNCSNEQLLIACENLELPVGFTIVGQEIKTMRRVIDFTQTRQAFINFWSCKDNLN